MTACLAETIPVGPLACNCSIVADEETGLAIVIDAGDESAKILAGLRRAGAEAVFLLHTHAHFDHIAGTRGVKESSGAQIGLHPADLFLYEALVEQGRMFDCAFEDPLPVDLEIEDGQVLEFGTSRVRVLHTPGHTPGSVSFLLEGQESILFSGDTLFRDSIGRTDLWGGSFAAIEKSIRSRLYALPEDLRVIPGHGPETTIGREKRSNPFVAG
jgi:glyoxylase-like metal-dependent hydrolase (beta-lactamase superfamily II)